MFASLELTEGPPHLLDDLHLIERRRRVSRWRGRHRRRPDVPLRPRYVLLAGGARRLRRGPAAAPAPDRRVERVAMVVAELARLLRQTPEPLRLVPAVSANPRSCSASLRPVGSPRGPGAVGLFEAGADGLIDGFHRQQRINCSGGAMF